MNPIFVVGISGRCGTNFVTRLLDFHQDCIKATVKENGSLNLGDPLFEYINILSREWETEDGLRREEIRNQLFPIFGESILRYINPNSNDLAKRLITSTTNPNNINYFPKMYPYGKVVFIVRDGRSVIESMVKTSNKTHDDAMSIWKNGAISILNYVSIYNNGNIIIRYEDLIIEFDKTMKQLLKFLELDLDKYDFEVAKELPIIGSSFNLKNNGKPNMEPLEKTEEFKFTDRSESWDDSFMNLFNKSCDVYMKNLGYY